MQAELQPRDTDSAVLCNAAYLEGVQEQERVLCRLVDVQKVVGLQVREAGCRVHRLDRQMCGIAKRSHLVRTVVWCTEGAFGIFPLPTALQPPTQAGVWFLREVTA